MTKNINTKKEITVRDPVCGMRIEPDDAADMEIYKGKLVYFCAPGCKRNFLENPELYLSNIKEIVENNEFLE